MSSDLESVRVEIARLRSQVEAAVSTMDRFTAAVSGALALVIKNQGTHTEMLRQITLLCSPPEGESPLHELLERMASSLERVEAEICGPPQAGPAKP